MRHQFSKVVRAATAGITLLLGGCFGNFDESAFLAALPAVCPAEQGCVVLAIGGIGYNRLGDQTQGFIKELAETLDADHFKVVNLGGWGALMPEVAEACTSGKRIVIAAHSLGNNEVIERMLPLLRTAGMRIDWVMLDASLLDVHFAFAPRWSGRIPALEMVVNVFSRGPHAGRALDSDDFEDPDAHFVNMELMVDHVSMISTRNAQRIAAILLSSWNEAQPSAQP